MWSAARASQRFPPRSLTVVGLDGGRERERELRREGGKSLLAYVTKGVDPYLVQIGPLPFGAQNT